MKKIFSILLCLLILSHWFIQTFANIYYSDDIMSQKKNAVMNIINTKSELKKISDWNKYIITIDNMVSQIDNSADEIIELQNRIYIAMNTLETKKWDWIHLTDQENIIFLILNYLDARLSFMQLDILQTEIEIKESQLAKALEEIKNPRISESDKKKLEDAIIIIQKNVLEKTKQNTYEILWDLEEYINYENSGDFEMDLNIDHESIWEVQAKLKISDYISQNSNFDSRFTGHISAMVDALPKWEDAMKAEFNSFFDFISKDGQIYALAEDLEIITDENIDIIQDTLDTFTTLAKENKYIEISDEESIAAMNFIQSLDPDTFFSDAEQLFSQSMFTAYKKEAEVYSLIPTKYACDIMKDLMNKFDPFSPNSCTQWQYQDLIEDIVSNWELTMTLGKENVLKYIVTRDEQIDKVEMAIAFTDSSIEKINIDIFPNQRNNPNEKLVFAYEKNKNLDFELYAEQWEVDIMFEASLDPRNNISSLEHTWFIQGWYDTQDWNINIKNRKITWEYTLEILQETYNYETWEYEENNPKIFQINLSWNNNSKNEINNINITYTWNDSELDFLQWDIVYDLPQLKIYNNYSDNYWEAVFNFDSNWNTRNKNFDEFELSADVMKKTSTFNSETYTREYSDKKEKVFNMNYSLKNTNLAGKLNVYDNEEIVFWIVTDWNYEKNKLELNNQITTDFIDTFHLSNEAKNSRIIADIVSLSQAIEISWTIPSVDNFWEDISQHHADFVNPYGNIEIDNCKYWYLYERNETVYQISSCVKWSDTYLKWTYIEWVSEPLTESWYLEWYTSWEKIGSEIHSSPVVNFNFGYDYRSNNANSQLYIDAIFEDETVFEINMKNTWTIEYKDIQIEAPINSVPLEDVFEINSYNYYY